ncbi:hypothetical protein GWK47_024787 [Chionoecetes opilio]|uniref:Uncharacterized protein n=1 Tax=Chionoecetes opilio TaxID=41210 RepID=A0A8J4XPL4_CHIOP|nr:hypothetical protein GWK47_024787 [Chionoecetes opilio]
MYLGSRGRARRSTELSQRSVPHAIACSTPEQREGHSFHSGLLSTSQRQLGFQHLKLEAVDGLGHPPGLMEKLQDGGMVWLDLHHRGTGRKTEKFFISSLGWFFDIKPPSGRPMRRPSVAGSVIGGEELYEVLRCFHRLSLRGIPEGPSITESFEDSNVRTRGRAQADFEDILEDHLLT